MILRKLTFPKICPSPNSSSHLTSQLDNTASMPTGQHFSALRAKKRKAGPSSSSSSSKLHTASTSKLPTKFRNAAPSALDWKNIHLPGELGFDEDGGLLELDEIEGVDVVYEDGRVQFKVTDTLSSYFQNTSEAHTVLSTGQRRCR